MSAIHPSEIQTVGLATAGVGVPDMPMGSVIGPLTRRRLKGNTPG